MKWVLQSEESSRFEALWEQYADLVYNLSIRLSGSAKQGWFLTRGTFLDARRKWTTLEGQTPSLWLTRLAIDLWLTSYFEQRTLWRRLFFKRKNRREMMLPSTVDSGLIFLSEEQEALLYCLDTLTDPERLVAVLQFGDDFSTAEIARLSPFREGKIKKYAASAARRLAAVFRNAGISKSTDAAGQLDGITSVIRQWRTIKAPLTLKVEIMNRRVSLQRMEQVHIPNEYSLKGMVLLLLALMILLITSFGYYWHVGHAHSSADVLMRL